MMGMPAAAGLFHRAATMSGQQVTVSGPLNATARTRAYLAALRRRVAGRAAALCRREALVEGLDATDPILGGGVYFGPVLDMKWLTRHPFWPDANPQSNAHPDDARQHPRRDPRLLRPGPSRSSPASNWDNLAERIGAGAARRRPSRMGGGANIAGCSRPMSPEQVFFAATTAGAELARRR